jgi:hypothetical protein
MTLLKELALAAELVSNTYNNLDAVRCDTSRCQLTWIVKKLRLSTTRTSQEKFPLIISWHLASIGEGKLAAELAKATAT